MPMPTLPHENRLSVFRTAARPRDLPDEYHKAFTERAAAIELELVHFLTKSNAAKSSPHLTDKGATDALNALSTAQLHEVTTSHRGVRDKLIPQIDAAKAAALKHASTPEDAALKYMRHRDIVDFYNAQDPLMHRQILDEAVREKDLDFVDALANAPRYRRKFDPALVASAREQLAEAADPGIARLTALLGSYDRLYQNAATVVRETAAQAGISHLAAS